MKIGFVLDDSLDKTDGVQQHILTLGRWFSQHGHEVHYLVGQTKRRDLENIHSLAKNIKTTFNGNAMTTPLPASRRRIKKLLSNEKFDVLHVQLPYSPLLAGRVIKLAAKNTPIIGTFHILPYNSLSKAANYLLGWLQQLSLKRFSKFYAVSKPAADFAGKAFKIKAEILPNPVDIAKFQVKKPKSQNEMTIAFLGRLVERKGCQELLNAVALLKRLEQLGKTRVIIGGDGPQRLELEKFIKDKKLTKYVTFKGYIDEAEKPNFLSSADIAVFPSISGESFGIVLIEAMATNSPVVIAGKNPGYQEVMANRSELLVNPLNTSEFAHKLLLFMTDPDLRAKTVAWQVKHVKQFDVTTVGQKLLDTYKQLQT